MSKRRGALAASESRPGPFEFEEGIDEICALGWTNLSQDDLVDVVWVYYYFSIQFRENLEIACHLYPDDLKLMRLREEECRTDNLSPWPAVASIGEKMNHDEFMRRLLELASIDYARRSRLEKIGRSYLCKVRELDDVVRASSIASYENGGLERVFRAILMTRNWNNPLLEGFRHFLTEHIRFDNDPENGHGALSGHLRLNDEILPLWTAFREILIAAAPTLIL
jgi:hypothetical protein